MNAEIVTSRDLEINLILRDAIADLLANEVSMAVESVYPEMDPRDAQTQYVPRSDDLICFEVAIGYDIETFEGEVARISPFVSDFPRKAELIAMAMNRRMASEDYGRVSLAGKRQFRFSLLSIKIRPGAQVTHRCDSTVIHLAVFAQLQLEVEDVSEQR